MTHNWNADFSSPSPEHAKGLAPAMGPDTRQPDMVSREAVIEYIQHCSEVFARQPDFPERAGIQRLLGGLIDGVKRL